MKRHPKYILKLEDESRLSSIINIRLTRFGMWISGILFISAMFLLAGIFIVATPLKTLLPGYMKQQERAATEENMLRLDSIQEVYKSNQAYIDNFVRALDTERVPNDSILIVGETRELSSDSLLPASPLEREFVDAMEERERFNISVLAPLAAEGMMFSPVAESGIFTLASKDSTRGEILMNGDEPVLSISDGSVLASYYSPAEKGYVILIQHAKGFVSRYEGLGNPMVSAGDMVSGGQMISLSPKPDAMGRRIVALMMWHNGISLKPFEYIGSGSGHTYSKDDNYEAPRGR